MLCSGHKRGEFDGEQDRRFIVVVPVQDTKRQAIEPDQGGHARPVDSLKNFA
jgi:hypothetical protein